MLRLAARAFITPLTVVTSLLCLGLGCASRHSISKDYNENLQIHPELHSGKRTTIFFLVDGLPAYTIKEMVAAAKLPQIEKYFLAAKEQDVSYARAVFPSLTFANISSWLTTRPVHEHGIVGNQMAVSEERKLNFESPFDRDDLNQLLGDKTIFSRLAKTHRTSVSFAPYFFAGATAKVPDDLHSGLAFLDFDFKYVDDKTLDGLENLLTATPMKQWPEFIFVHLVGFDSIEHNEGPRSSEALDYLIHLDAKLGEVFELLALAERKGKNIVSLMSADHGFAEIKASLDIEKLIHAYDPSIHILPQSRMAAIQFPKSWNAQKRSELLRLLSQTQGISLAAQHLGNDIIIDTGGVRAALQYKKWTCPKTDYSLNFRLIQKDSAVTLVSEKDTFFCPEAFDQSPKQFYGPYFISNFASYFHSETAPDAVLIASPHITFHEGFKGDHGGATSDEVLVPLLIRNAHLQKTVQIPAVYDVLKFITANPAP